MNKIPKKAIINYIITFSLLFIISSIILFNTDLSTVKNTVNINNKTQSEEENISIEVCDKNLSTSDPLFVYAVKQKDSSSDSYLLMLTVLDNAGRIKAYSNFISEKNFDISDPTLLILMISEIESSDWDIYNNINIDTLSKYYKISKNISDEEKLDFSYASLDEEETNETEIYIYGFTYKTEEDISIIKYYSLKNKQITEVNNENLKNIFYWLFDVF